METTNRKRLWIYIAVAYFYVVFRVKYGSVDDVSSYVAMTLAENVLMRRPQSEDDYAKVRRALVDGQFDCEHRGLTKGLDTVISREFDELMALNGRYREMFDRQAQNYIV